MRWVVIATAVAGFACGAEQTPSRQSCDAVVWALPQRAGGSVSIRGSWDDWAGDTALQRFVDDPQWLLAELSLPPGEHGYLLVEAGTGRLDRFNPLSTFRSSDEQEVSLLRVPDCGEPQLEITAVDVTVAGSVEVRGTFVAADDGRAPVAGRAQARLSTGVAVPAEVMPSGDVRVATSGLARGRHSMTVEVEDDAGRIAEAAAAVWVDPVADSHPDEIIYQIMIDRFRGDGGAVLAPPATPGGRAGGTLPGITAEIENGMFEALGVSTLWLTPVYVNPDEARAGVDGVHQFEGYHGYWPVDSRGVDPRIGGSRALTDLVSAAHAHGLRVVLDFVPNHIYETNERVGLRDSGWFNEHDEQCVCGTASCPWAGFIETCWFAPYLLDLRMRNPEVMQATVDDVTWWMDTFNLDGVRIDAVPMMPRAATRRIVDAVRTRQFPPEQSVTLGEIFTSGGQPGIDTIRFYLGPDSLDSAFDFPLMWAIRDALGTARSDFGPIEDVLNSTELALDGSTSHMALIIGNHDVTRFTSVAAGDSAGDPWTDPPPQPTIGGPYDRVSLALGLILTLPGMPVLYYGDEVGLAGGGDPDNRRVMPALDSVSPDQTRVLDLARRLGTLRRCTKALRAGARTPVLLGADDYGFVRKESDGEPILVVLHRGNAGSQVSIPANAVPSGWYKDGLTGQRFELGVPDAAVEMPPWSIRVLLPEGDPCASL